MPWFCWVSEYLGLITGWFLRSGFMLYTHTHTHTCILWMQNYRTFKRCKRLWYIITLLHRYPTKVADSVFNNYKFFRNYLYHTMLYNNSNVICRLLAVVHQLFKRNRIVDSPFWGQNSRCSLKLFSHISKFLINEVTHTQTLHTILTKLNYWNVDPAVYMKLIISLVMFCFCIIS
jgi:hypothetical protein